MWANLFECLFQFIVSRLGRWIDFEKDYKTLYPWFMETIWYGEREERGEGGEGRGGDGRSFMSHVHPYISASVEPFAMNITIDAT